MKKTFIIFLLLLPLVFANVNGPYIDYVDYGTSYDVGKTIILDPDSNMTIQCVNSLGETFSLTTLKNDFEIKYICDFEYTSPFSGKGVDNINYTLKLIDDYITTDFTDKYTLYYGYCPNVPCSSNQECVNNQCQELCGNGEIDSGETCSSCSQDVICQSNEKCNAGVCEVYCGNNEKNVGETCSSCPLDVICKSNEQCSNGVCQGFCGNKKKDSGETCSSCPQDAYCKDTEHCVLGVCEGYCGNNVIDSGEWCTNCPQDAGCHNGYVCSTTEFCVKLGTAENCASLNDSCGTGYCVNNLCVECMANINCESKQIYGEGFICSPDNKYVLEKGYELSGTCNLGKCSGEKVDLTPKQFESCGNAGCQDGHCGCSDGYKFCQPLSKCKKVADFLDNARCSCDFECQSGYCGDDQKCITPLNVKLSVNKENIEVGEKASVTLSVDNNLDETINTNLALNIGAGFDMTAVDGGMDCSTNQCKKSIIIPKRGRTKLIVDLEGNSATVSQITGAVTYFMADHIERNIPLVNMTEVIITECGDGIISEGENAQNCCTDYGCPKNHLFSTVNCQENVCVKETRSGLSMFYIILFIAALIIIYKILHPYIIDWRRPKPSNRCLHCGLELRLKKIFCHNCGKKNSFEKEHVDLSHLFDKKKKK
jgi:hypothetical protein